MILIKLNKLYEKINPNLIGIIKNKINEFIKETRVNPDKIIVPINKKEKLLHQAKYLIGDYEIHGNYISGPIRNLNDMSEPEFPKNEYFVSKLFGIDVSYHNRSDLLIQYSIGGISYKL